MAEQEGGIMSVKSMHGLSVGKKPVVPTNHFYDKPNPPADMKTQYWFYCIETDDGIILVDQSFTNEQVKRMNIPFSVDKEPLELLSGIGVLPEDVSKVLVTHLHWDHFAGNNWFPNAKYYLHKKELDHAAGPLMRFPIYRQHYSQYVTDMVPEMVRNGKMILLEGKTGVLADGVEWELLGGHTPGLIGVVVHKDGKNKVICSDVLPRYQNFDENIPCGIHYDVTEALIALERLHEIAGSSDNVLPGHDPLIAERHEEVAPGVFKIL